MSFLVAVEGIDGSGKGTQSSLLVQSLREQGLRAELISFPRYQSTRYGEQIGHFLNGGFGSLNAVHPVLVSLLFAGDRFESREYLQQLLVRNDVVVCDRYVSSNIAHQGAKTSPAERAALRQWIEFVEYEQHQMPRADLTFWLDVPVATAQEWIGKKNQRSYTDRVADLQEEDASYLAAVRAVYADLAANEARWRTVQVLSTDGTPRSLEDIAAELGTAVLEARR